MEPLPRTEYRIAEVKAIGDGRIRARFKNGQWVEVDFRNLPEEGDLIAVGNLFGKLAEDSYLAQVRVGDYGHWIEWPGELDFGADQIWWWGRPVVAHSNANVRKAS